MSETDLVREVLTGQSACFGCFHRQDCAEQRIACKRFAAEVGTIHKPRGVRPDAISNHPDRYWYGRIFSDAMDAS